MSTGAGHLGNCFAAGALGGLANAVAVWLAGASGFTAALKVNLAPALTSGLIYQRMVWGGIFGLLMFLPLFRRSIFWRGVIFSLAPSAVQLLAIFPQAGQGLYGLALGTLTPALVLLFNFIWGWFAAAWLRGSDQ
ncbi:MAG: hypothetical protein C4525_15335 [Desulfarculus sp.]|jgi:hypothetical protein|nr:MAG: hypothetical protein C4525_15335 [Desulfarculus sp.]